MCKNFKQANTDWRGIFLHIRCICFMINLTIKDKLPEYLNVVLKYFPKESELFTGVSKTAFTEIFIESKQLRRDLL